jgi:hypothetical protein
MNQRITMSIKISTLLCRYEFAEPNKITPVDANSLMNRRCKKAASTTFILHRTGGNEEDSFVGCTRSF